MDIVVFYSKFKPKNGTDAADIKRLMKRDSSWGTFIDNLHAAKNCCADDAEERWKKLEPSLRNLSKGGHEDEYFSMTLPMENFNFETEGVDHFISTIAGDIVLNPAMEEIEVDDFNIKDSGLEDYFPGPNIGIDRLYSNMLSKTLEGIERPILAFTVKPRIGLNIEDYKSLFIEAAMGGVDIIEDDERLIDTSHCPFDARVDALSEIQNDFDTLYSVNITGTVDNAIRRLDYAVKKGIKMVKFDVLVYGFETLRQIALHIKNEYESNVAITVYPDAYRAYRRLSRKFILRMSRLCGADIIYAGSPNWARYEKEGGPLKESIEPIHTMHQILSEKIDGASDVKEALPTITNDQHPSRAETITAYFRKHYKHLKFAFFVGGGISGFPDSLSNAVVEWLKCLKHVIAADLSKYDVYNFDRYESSFNSIGWKQMDVRKALEL